MKLNELNKKVKYENLILFFQEKCENKKIKKDEQNEKFPFNLELIFSFIFLDSSKTKFPFNIREVYEFINDYSQELKIKENFSKNLINLFHSFSLNSIQIDEFSYFLKLFYKFIETNVDCILILLDSLRIKTKNDPKNGINDFLILISYISKSKFFKINLQNFNFYKVLDEEYYLQFLKCEEVWNRIIYDLEKIIHELEENSQLLNLLDKKNLLNPIINNCSFQKSFNLLELSNSNEINEKILETIKNRITACKKLNNFNLNEEKLFEQIENKLKTYKNL